MGEKDKNLENMEKLFLLELLVENVELDYEKLKLDENLKNSLKQTCVRCQFLNYPPLDICEEDFCNVVEEGYGKERVEFRSGKSCLFSLRGLPAEVRGLEICTSVGRQREGGGGELHQLAKTRITLGSSFTNILTSPESSSSEPGNGSQTTKDTHPLFDEKGNQVGRITVFVRLSCFGKTIITSFQESGVEKRSFLFKRGKAGEELGGEPSSVSDPYVQAGDGGRGQGTAGGDAPPLPPCPPEQQQAQHWQQASQQSQGAMPPPGDVAMGSDGYPGGRGGGGAIQGDGYHGTNLPGGGFPGSEYPGSGYPGERYPGAQEAAIGQGPTFGQGPAFGQGPTFGQGSPFGQDPIFGQGSPYGQAPTFGQAPALGQDPTFGQASPYSQGPAFGQAPPYGHVIPGGMPPSAGGFQQAGFPIQGQTPAGYPVSQRPQEASSQPSEADQEFKEIGVEINGHSLSIKVPRRKKKPKVETPQIPFCGKVPGSESSGSESETESGSTQPAGNVGDLNWCGCDVPMPPGFYGAQQPQQKHKKKKKPKCPLEPSGNMCLKPDCPMGYPTPNMSSGKPEAPPFQTPAGAIGLKGEQVVFAMPKQGGFKTNPNANYTFAGNPDSNLQKVQLMTEELSAAPPAASPLNDIFLLKVGKNNPNTGRRSLMNLEVKSPRKEEKKMVDAQTQYQMEEEKPKAAGKKGKKGKKK